MANILKNWNIRKYNDNHNLLTYSKLNTFFKDLHNFPSINEAADAKASVVSSNFWKCFNLTLKKNKFFI